jgi:GT2 family glycosyltransferase
MKITAIVVNFNGGDKVVELIKKLRTFPTLDQIVVVDNNSTDKSFLAVKKIDQESRKIIALKNKENVGFAAGVNVGATAAFKKEADKIILLNPDIEITNDQILKLSKNRASVVSPVLTFWRGKKQVLDFGGIINWWLGRTTHLEVTSAERLVSPFHLYDQTKVEYVSGACMVISKLAFQRVKGFDERFFLYFEDADFCLRIRKAGYAIQVNHKIVVTHTIDEHRQTKNKFKIAKNLESNLLFIAKWIKFPQKIVALTYWNLLKIKVFLNQL